MLAATLPTLNFAAAAATSSAAPGGPTGTIAVVIPCLNESAYIAGVLDAIRSQDQSASEVIVVDGGSTDGTLDALRAYAQAHPDFPLRVLHVTNATIAAAMNAGVAASRSDVVVRMDAHSRPATNYVRLAVEALRETGASVVGGVWHTCPGSGGAMAAAIAKAVTHPLGAGDAQYRLDRRHQRTAVDTVPFGCYRRSHWERIGGYNEALVANEDYEFNYRTRLAGGGVVLDPAIRCDYFARPSLRALARQYFRYGWWKGRMLRQHPRSIRWRQAIPALFVPGWAALAGLAALLPAARPTLIALLAVYGVALLYSARQVARSTVTAPLRVAAAFATIHGAWSLGIVSFVVRRVPGAQVTLGVLLVAGLTIGTPWQVGVPLDAESLGRVKADAARIAESVRAGDILPPGGPGPAFLVVGDGAVPRLAPVITTSMTQHDVPLVDIDADPWGNRYVLYRANAGGTGERLWVVSAGPNGVLETSLPQSDGAAPTGGDDLAFSGN